MAIESLKWNNGMVKLDAEGNKTRNHIKRLFLSILGKNGFEEVDLPILDYSEKYILNNEYHNAQNHYKSIAPNGEVLSIADDLIAGLLSFSQTEIETKGRLCADRETYSFLSQKGKTNMFQVGGIIYGESGIAEECDVILCAKKFAESIGIRKPKIILSNTNIFGGVLSGFAKKEESIQRLKGILDGKIENDIDYATVQTISPLKNAEGGSEIIKELATKLDNKQSIDGLLDLFEITNFFDAYNINENVVIQPKYLGENYYDNGVVFRVEDEKGRVIAFGGRCDCLKGKEALKSIYVQIDSTLSTEIAKENGIFEQEKSNTVIVAISGTRQAVSKAYKVRNDLYNEGLKTEVIYNAEEKDVYTAMAKNKNGMVIYINGEGNITHS